MINPVLPRIWPRHARRSDPGQPDRALRDRRPEGRHRPDRAQDHRRHATAAWRRTAAVLLRQGSDEGRPLRGLHGPVRREEHRGGGPGGPRCSSRWRTRSASAHPVSLMIDTFGTEQGRPGRCMRSRSRSCSTSVRRRSSATSICAARSTATPRRTGTSAERFPVGGDRPGRGPAPGALVAPAVRPSGVRDRPSGAVT